MVNRGADTVVAEISSHALRLGRVDGTDFTLAAFTNLSQDHLDFHDDMEDYYQAKRSLFDPSFTDTGVICVDDEWGSRLANDVGIEVRTVSMGGHAEYTSSITEATLEGMQVAMRFPNGEVLDVALPLIGEFNARNALIAAACADVLGAPIQDIVKGLESTVAAPGRFELVSGDDPIRLVVDYAHTPEGIGTVIDAVRAMTRGRIIAVVGAGGDRDQAKRPLMGAAGSRSDVLIVTSDNPRSEDPDQIIADVLSGVSVPDVHAVTDRRSAIQTAVESARDGDVVLVLGKGHERSQEIRGRMMPFDDRVVARAALATHRGRAG